nr:TIGR03111 family XrtG-associated glycosyltransferase [Ardenticatena sp.]
MSEQVWRFIIFWGVWLLVPLLVDLTTTLANMAGVLALRYRRRRLHRPLTYYPFISIVIPVYNSEETLEPCLRSLAAQDYPIDRMEILCISNGTTDNSFEVFARLQAELPLHMRWHTILNKGKAWALNAGIHIARGQYIFNIDSDVVLAPDAVRKVVKVMEVEPDMVAATGSIQVLPPPPDAPFSRRVLAECEFFEYLTAFHVGREHQTLLNNLYTLSGAFSIFRREALLETFLYSQLTVTEDTDLTFQLYERFHGKRVGAISSAIAYVHSIESLGALYAQRVRWQRGQVEVSARYRHLLNRPVWALLGFNPRRVLLVDHTLSFPRAVWTFLLPVLVVFGYPLSLIVMTFVFLYGFYLSIDLLWVAIALSTAPPFAWQRLRYAWWVLFLLPAYRMLVYWFRLSGFLHAMAEPGTWRVNDPVVQIRQGLANLQQRAAHAYTAIMALLE